MHARTHTYAHIHNTETYIHTRAHIHTETHTQMHPTQTHTNTHRGIHKNNENLYFAHQRLTAVDKFYCFSKKKTTINMQLWASL